MPSHGPGHSPGHGEGGHSPIIPIPIPIPTRPPYTPYYPPPYYPKPSYTPRPYTTPVPPNTVPAQPQPPAEPEANVALVEPETNDFTKELTFRPITAKELAAFKDQITKKSEQLGDELKKLFQGNEQAIDELVALANSGKLTADALKKFVTAFGGGLALQP